MPGKSSTLSHIRSPQGTFLPIDFHHTDGFSEPLCTLTALERRLKHIKSFSFSSVNSRSGSTFLVKTEQTESGTAIYWATWFSVFGL